MRSFLFVPGHRERMVERALSLGEFSPTGVDVAILDLEDGVPLDQKGSARTVVAAALGRSRSQGGVPRRFVRVNASRDELERDLEAVIVEEPDGLVIPKVHEIDEALDVARLAELHARRSGVTAVALLPSIESARGLLAAPGIARCSEHVVGLLFGAEDFALDLGLPAERTGDAAELLYARSAVVVAAAAAGKIAIDGIWPDIRDLDGLRRDARRGRQLGFAGKSVVHPSHVEIVNEIFAATADEIAYAERVVAAFTDAQARGVAAVELDGTLLDPPIVARAKKTLDRK